MPLIITKRIPNDNFPINDWFVMVEPHPVRTRLEEGPRTEEDRQALANLKMREAYAQAISEEKTDDEAAEIATRVGVQWRKQLSEIGLYDRRSQAVLLYYAEDPGEDLKKRAQVVHREQIAYDHDFSEGAEPDARVQAYNAVKAAMPEARDA